ncbi:MAG: metal ABC transporter solute-binding protein, Zn/Mn family [Bacteroidota bacterium]
MKRLLITAGIALMVVASSCSQKTRTSNQKPVVTVSIQPQKFFVEAIADTLCQVNVMIPPGSSPATFDAGAEQMRQLTHSQLYLAIGHVVFENNWGDRFRKQNPQMKWVDQSKDVVLIEGEHVHHHHEGEAHVHKGVDPHVWTSPKAMKKQLPVVYEALVALLPEHEEFLQKRYDRILMRVDSLDKAVETSVAAMEQRKFMIFHPAYTYFARDYGLEQLPIEFEGKEPTPGHLKEIVQTGREEGIQYVFIQREFPIEKAQVVADEIDAEVVVVEPLAYDWFKAMEHLLTQLAN